MALLALVPFAHFGHAAGTPAGTSINNTASVTFVSGGTPQSGNSNTSTIRVDEVLNVTIAGNGVLPVPSPDSERGLSFTITNTGNGPEQFNLAQNTAFAADQFDPAFVRFAVDTNGSGAYEPASDAAVTSVTLNPDQTVVVFLVSNVPAGQAGGDAGRAQLTATAATGSGAPGTTFAGQGTGGGDAVAGATGASANAENSYVVSQVQIAFAKASNPPDGSNAAPGQIVTYMLTLTLSGSGSVNNGVVSDPIPNGTSYVVNSISLNGTPLSDAGDADQGRFNGVGNAIEVSLGAVTAGDSHTITFQVRIN